MTSDDKDSLLNRDNLTQPIRTPLSQKQKAFSELFVPFSKRNRPFDRQHGKRVQTQLQSGRTPLSQKQKAFSELFVPFSKSTLNFEHFRKKDDPHS